MPPFFFIKTFFLLSLFFPTNLASDAKGYKDCAPFTCGNFSDISYPFWNKNQPDYCGHPMFKLDCQQDNVTIDIMSQNFLVLYMNQTSQILKIARLDLWGANPCPNQYINVNLDFSFFSYTSNDHNYTLLYDCNPLPFTPPANFDPTMEFTCPKDGDPGYGYLVFSTDLGYLNDLGCKNNITVPVAIQSSINYVGSVLDEGFEVGWSGVDGDKCYSCIKSGGRCGFNASINAFMCFCLNQQSYGGICGKNSARSPLASPTRALLPPYPPENSDHATSMYSSFS